MSKLFKSEVPFGMVPNALLNDENISLKAKGLFAFMQSKPEGWNFSAKLISTQCKESIDSISSGLHELEKYGFLRREKKQTAKGFIITYHLAFNFKNPIAENPILENPILENPMIGKSLNNSNKDISNKELSKKEESTALAFFQSNFPSEYERLMMQFQTQIIEWKEFVDSFEATVDQEGLKWELNVLRGRFTKYALNWIRNQSKYESKVVEMVTNGPMKKINSL